MAKKYKIGFTQGVYDMFHVGHLNLLLNAKKYCDKLIVAVNSDKLVMEYKKRRTIINQYDRKYIVENIKCVDDVFIVDTLDKRKIYETLKFDAIFIGDDWKGNSRWIETEKQMAKEGVDVVYLPYTKEISSSKLRESIE